MTSSERLSGVSRTSYFANISLLMKIKKKYNSPSCECDVLTDIWRLQGGQSLQLCVCPSGVDVQTWRHVGDAESVPLCLTILWIQQSGCWFMVVHKNISAWTSEQKKNQPIPQSRQKWSQRGAWHQIIDDKEKMARKYTRCHKKNTMTIDSVAKVFSTFSNLELKIVLTTGDLSSSSKQSS